MRPTRRYCWISLAAAMCAAGAELRAEDLRYKFEQGEKLLFSMTQNVTISLTAEGAPDQEKSFEQTIEQVTDILWSVDEVQEDGTAKISQTVERIRLNVHQPHVD